MKAIDMTGQTFGRLTVIARVGSSKQRHAQWVCSCECGNTVIVPRDRLRTGNTKSCGCYKSQVCAERAAKRNSREIVRYAGAHKRLGRATDYTCVDCGEPAYDWSYDGLDPSALTNPDTGCAFSLDPEHYRPRCRPCHRAFDRLAVA